MRHHRPITAALALMLPAFATLAHENHPTSDAPSLLREFRPIGGAGNNRQHPELNAMPGQPELTIAPLYFATGTSRGVIDGPNARTISNVISGGTGADGDNGQTPDPVASAWLYVFGQFLDHDLGLENTPPTTERIDITVPPLDPVFAQGTTIAMTRAVADPSTNTIINTVAGYLDLSQLYGSTEETAASLRNPDGTLVSSNNGRSLPIQNGAYVTGDPRVMENPELTAVTTLFMREHNYWVGQLKAQSPSWSGDQLYDMARAITTAEYQQIVYNEYLPLLIGRALGPYSGYDPEVNPQVTQEFTTAAFRVGHSQISDTQEGVDNSGNVVFEQSLAEAFFNTPAQDEAHGFDPLLRSLALDFAQATDVYCVDALRNLLFAPLVGGDVDQIDLIAIDIQRQRDVGLAPLNATRRALGLRPYRSFAELTDDPALRSNLQAIYGSIDDVDLFIGGLAERHAWGALVGTTFQTIIARQFDALRAGDRFFWRNQAFDRQTAEMISQVTLGDIVKRNTDSTSVPDHVFEVAQANHVHRHVPPPAHMDGHGRHRPFVGDGW